METLPSLTTADGVPRPITRAPFNSPKHDRLCMAGLGLGALSGLICLAAIGSNGQLAVQGSAFTSITDGALFWAGGLVALAFALTLALPYAWARFTGIGVMPIVGFVYVAVVFVSKDDPVRFNDFDPILTGDAGRFFVFAFVVLLVGLVLALVGAPRIGRPVDGDAVRQPGASGYAVTSLVLSLCGLVTAGLSAPLGIAFGVAGLDDVSRSGGLRGGRGLAVAGLVVGIVFTALGVLFVSGGLAVTDPQTIQDVVDESAAAWWSF